MNPDQQTNKPNTDPAAASKETQEQSDPQLTELKGFIDPSEDLEPTLTDGTKAPDKEQERRKEDESIR